MPTHLLTTETRIRTDANGNSIYDVTVYRLTITPDQTIDITNITPEIADLLDLHVNPSHTAIRSQEHAAALTSWYTDKVGLDKTQLTITPLPEEYMGRRKVSQ